MDTTTATFQTSGHLNQPAEHTPSVPFSSLPNPQITAQPQDAPPTNNFQPTEDQTNSQHTDPFLAPQPRHHMTTKSKNGIFKPKLYHTNATTLPTNIPYYTKANLVNSYWKPAMETEYQGLINNYTWTLVPSEPHLKLIGNKWIFKVKQHPNGSISRLKARLVVKDFHQAPGIDYSQSFSPVVKPATIRIILSLASHFNWCLRQVDVNITFLNGDLKEDVFMARPEGFVDPSKPDHVCKLWKALYSLKQVARA